MKISLLHHVPPPDGFIVVVMHLYHHHPAFTPLDSTFVKKISMMNKRPPYQMGLEKSQSNLSSRNKPLIKHKSLLPPFRVHAIFGAFVTTIQLNSLYKWELRNCLFDCGWRDFEKCLMAPQNFPLALFRSINLCENLSRQPTTRFLHGDAGMVPIMFYASYMPPQPPPG